MMLWASVMCAGPAVADEDAGFALETWRPALSSDGLIDVEWGGVGRHLEFDVGLATGYAHRPLVLFQNGARVDSLVQARVHGSLLGAISLFDWVQLGVELPFVAYQMRWDSPLADAALGAASDVAIAGIGDARLMPKVRLLRAEDQFIDVAVIPGLYLPTGFPSDSYLGDGVFAFAPELAVSAPIGALRAAWNVGYRMRSEHAIGQTRIGPQLFSRGGIGVDLETLASVPLEIDVTLAGTTLGAEPFGADVTENALEAQLGLQYTIGSFQVAAYGAGGIVGGVGVPAFRTGLVLRYAARETDADGDSIEDQLDACPNQPEDKDGFEDSDGCPDSDNDADGVLDHLDACPGVAEDVDGRADEDGCPDPDDDGDGVLDVDDACPLVAGAAADNGCPAQDADDDGVADGVDACPNAAGTTALAGCPDQDGDGIADDKDACPTEAETQNGDRDDDGCPEVEEKPAPPEPTATLTAERIEISEAVYFELGRATIEPRSFALLDKVAGVLLAHPEIKKMRVEGHTDSLGADHVNADLSKYRAKKVVEYLVRKGVSAAVLEPVGFGEERPVADNATKEGREKNRRVEFIVVQSDAAADGGAR